MILRETNIRRALRDKQRGFLLNPFRFGGGGGGDPDYANVSSLMYFEGAVNGTVLTDEKGLTISNSGVFTSDVSVKFGGTSGRFNGSSHFDFPSVESLNFGTGDFTFELWGTNTLNNGARCLFSSPSGSIQFYNFQFLVNGASVVSGLTVGDNVSQFRHLAITRSGTTVRVFLNGVLNGSGTSSAAVDFRSLSMGRFVPNNNLRYTGYIDNLRITKGVARYTANFTPPTASFPNS